MTVAIEFLAAFVLIVGGALAFTNAVEWLGHRLDVGASAVGALLAAVGTALPESVIPIVALVTGGGEHATQIAIGAIVGAPFMLATVAMLLIALSAAAFRRRRENGSRVTVDAAAARRDLAFFLAAFPIAVAIGALGVSRGWRIGAAAVLVIGYVVYAWRTVKSSGSSDAEDLGPLYFDTTRRDPPSGLQVGAQFVVSLAAIVGGAELFVAAIESTATSLGVSVLVLALVLAPLATELPEKANSVLWVRQGKDQLALGNVTGAMTFQATVPVALGMLVTTWTLDRHAVVAGCVALVGAAVSLWAMPHGRVGLLTGAAWAALFSGFVAYAALA